MTDDARFEDGAVRPLRLAAADEEDLRIVSTLVQDAVLPVEEISWKPSARCFVILLNRFRWEDEENARKRGRAFERVQSVLAFEDVEKVEAQGVDPKEKDTVLSILGVSFKPGEDGAGTVELVLSGDGGLRLTVEAINATLTDVTRPYVAPSGQVPDHGPD
ncbi:MAG: DUF2948 family protein [Pseudomonadota bacterium]